MAISTKVVAGHGLNEVVQSLFVARLLALAQGRRHVAWRAEEKSIDFLEV